MAATRLPTYFISHGGGPWPYMPDMAPVMAKLKAALEGIAQEVGERPKAVLVITGHWEEREFTVSSSPEPPMIYDYGGFPAHTYQVTYRAPGSPELAGRVHSLLQAAGLPTRLDPQRGYDHGTFVPLAVMYPQAEVPVVQLSLRRDFDPAVHVAVGRAIAPLREEGVLIVGSGLSYHNLRAFGPMGREASHRFDEWLQEVLTRSTPEERIQQLNRWTQAPAARQAHPREEHLLPLMVAVGAAADEAGECTYHEEDFFGAMAVSNFRFGGLPAA
ncbi:MAG TPA: class III extradiol ring-cleavage dioxygenase [Stenomitos sp.]